MTQPLVRLALNFSIYFVFGGAILAFTSMRGSVPASLTEVIFAALAVASWSGGLTTLIEARVMRMPEPRPRAAVATVLGALSLGGFATILSSVAWRSPELGFIAIGLAAGGLMQGARAFSLGRRPSASDASDADDPTQLIALGALVLDVRSHAEWDSGHLEQATHLPMDELPQRLHDVEQWAGGKDKPIVVHCKGGGRAGRACAVLAAAGFTRVVNGGGSSALR